VLSSVGLPSQPGSVEVEDISGWVSTRESVELSVLSVEFTVEFEPPGKSSRGEPPDDDWPAADDDPIAPGTFGTALAPSSAPVAPR
jgi:hypothetical protein